MYGGYGGGYGGYGGGYGMMRGGYGGGYGGCERTRHPKPPTPCLALPCLALPGLAWPGLCASTHLTSVGSRCKQTAAATAATAAATAAACRTAAWAACGTKPTCQLAAKAQGFPNGGVRACASRESGARGRRRSRVWPRRGGCGAAGSACSTARAQSAGGERRCVRGWLVAQQNMCSGI